MLIQSETVEDLENNRRQPLSKMTAPLKSLNNLNIVNDKLKKAVTKTMGVNN